MSVKTTEIIDSEQTKLVIVFSDEGVNLTGETVVMGDEAAAMAYAPFFEADLRRNNAKLFPQPEPEPMPGMWGMEGDVE